MEIAPTLTAVRAAQDCLDRARQHDEAAAEHDKWADACSSGVSGYSQEATARMRDDARLARSSAAGLRSEALALLLISSVKESMKPEKR